MGGDYSRRRFDPRKDYSSVLMQQGRVQLDADWNELMEIRDRRMRAETTDIMGRCVVPRETPEGFEITVSGGKLTIGRGRIYVDGLLAENHGKGDPEFDGVLGELRGKDPIPYDEQPYYDKAVHPVESPPQGGPHLVYIDVWQREVTCLEKPDLIEPAVGVDTTTRLQTVWQVKVHSLPAGSNTTCDTPEDKIPGWMGLTRPSAGRLTTEAVGVPDDQDPCEPPITGGYRGLENQLYRVEIHNAAAGSETFKWSRDNATVATAVTAINGTKLTVGRTGRDSNLRFNPGDWAEITDDGREFAGKPGVMRKVKNVIDATQTIELESALPAADFPVDAQGKVDAERHTRIRRWDQKGQVLDTNGNVIIDLDAPGGSGLIPVKLNTPILLENGIRITFSTEPSGGKFRTGDYWVFAARADASLEELEKAPPAGTHHHYGRLAVVNFPDKEEDCRVLWPPECEEMEGCAVPVGEGGRYRTLHEAFAALQKNRDISLCLLPGTHEINQDLEVRDKNSIKITGFGPGGGIRQRSRQVLLSANSILLQDLGLRVENETGRIVLSGNEVTAEGCAFMRHVGSGDVNPLVLVRPAGSAATLRFRNNRVVSWWAEVLSKDIGSYLIPVDDVRLSESARKRLEKLSKSNPYGDREAFTRAVDAVAKDMAGLSGEIRNLWFRKRPTAKINALPAESREVVKKFYADLKAETITVEGIRKDIESIMTRFLVAHYSEALALEGGVGGWIEDNVIDGRVILHYTGKYKPLLWAKTNEKQRMNKQRWADRNQYLIIDPAMLSLRGNLFYMVCSNGYSIMQVLNSILNEGNWTHELPEAGYQTLTLSENIFRANRNSFVSQSLIMSGNHFLGPVTEPDPAACVLGYSGVFTGNIAPSQDRVIEKILKTGWLREAANLLQIQ